MTDQPNYEQELHQYQESLYEPQDDYAPRFLPNPDEYSKSSRSNNRRMNNKKHKRNDEKYH